MTRPTEPESPPREPVTVVIPCRDRPDLLRDCLARLAAALDPTDVIIVSDSASRDPVVGTVAIAAGARLVRCDRPGTSRARNAGWRAAATRIVAFVDDDVMVEPGWVDALLKPFAAPETGFAVGRTTLPLDYAQRGMTASVMVVEPPAVITAGTSIDAGGGNLAVLRSALEAAGGYDERLGPGTWFQAGEDLELLDRVLGLGLVGRYAREAVGRHEQWRDDAGQLRLQWAYGKGMGARVACATRRNPRAGLAMFGQLLRLRGLRTAVRRLVPRRPGAAGAELSGAELSEGAEPVTVDDRGDAASGVAATVASPRDVSGWRGPVLWRLGAIVGLAAGLLRLSQRRRPQAVED